MIQCGVLSRAWTSAQIRSDGMDDTERLFIGIDVGKSTHHAVALDEAGRVILDRPLANNEDEIREVFLTLESLGVVHVAVDQPSDIGGLVVAVARDESLPISYLPGVAMRRLSELHRGQAKSDPRDAMVIAQAARTLQHVLRPLSAATEDAEQLRILSVFDGDLSKQVNEVSNRLRALLTRLNPSTERVLGRRLGHPAVLDLLHLYPSPDALRRAGREEIERCLRGRAPKIWKDIADDIEEALDEQTVTVPGALAAGAVIQSLVDQLRLLRAQKAEIAIQIEWLAEAHPLYRLVTTMPGVGVATAARIISEVVGRRFDSAAHLASFAGVAPVTRRSGSSVRGQRRSYRGNRALKRALVVSAFTAMQHDPESRAYYDRKLREGKRHRQALLALVRRRLDVLYAMLRDEEPYHSRGDPVPEVQPRRHRTKRSHTPSAPVTDFEMSWFVAHLRREGTFHTDVHRLPMNLEEFRRELREAAAQDGFHVETRTKGKRFFAEVVGFTPSESVMRAVVEAVGRAGERTVGRQ